MTKQLLLIGASALLFAAPQAMAHCEVPCGIYDNDNVLKKMETDLLTIEKAMKQINTLSKDSDKNANQLVRWVMNKESHAQSIQDVVAKYFLTQRVKLEAGEKPSDSYVLKLTTLHRVSVLAMKCKQTTDLKNVVALKREIQNLNVLFGSKKLKKALDKAHDENHGHQHGHAHGHKH